VAVSTTSRNASGPASRPPHPPSCDPPAPPAPHHKPTNYLPTAGPRRAGSPPSPSIGPAGGLERRRRQPAVCRMGDAGSAGSGTRQEREDTKEPPNFPRTRTSPLLPNPCRRRRRRRTAVRSSSSSRPGGIAARKCSGGGLALLRSRERPEATDASPARGPERGPPLTCRRTSCAAYCTGAAPRACAPLRMSDKTSPFPTHLARSLPRVPYAQ
jgi:hypothetical protein